MENSETTKTTKKVNTPTPQQSEQPRKTSIFRVFTWFALLGEWFSTFGELHKKHFPNETTNY